MKTVELYQTMISAVSRHTGIGESDIIESCREECVDARYLLIHFLSRFLTDEEIARQMGIPRQSVNRIRNRFECKINKWSVRSYLHDIGTELAQNPLITIIIAQ